VAIDEQMMELEVELNKILKIPPFRQIVTEKMDYNKINVPAIQYMVDGADVGALVTNANQKAWSLTYVVAVFDIVRNGTIDIKHARKITNKVANILERENTGKRLGGQAFQMNVTKVDYNLTEERSGLTLYGGLIECKIIVIENINE
jgi:hypothetical protein